MVKWLKKHWRTGASFACGAGAILLVPVSPLLAFGVAAGCTALGLSAGRAYELGRVVGAQVKQNVIDKK